MPYDINVAFVLAFMEVSVTFLQNIMLACLRHYTVLWKYFFAIIYAENFSLHVINVKD